MKLTRTIKKTAKTLALTLGINGAVIPISYITNRLITPKNHTAVFTSGYVTEEISSSLVAKFIDFFMFSPVILRETFEGNRVDWYSDASKSKLLNILESNKHQNLVFIGHGCDSIYQTSTTPLDVVDIETRNIGKRKGKLIQYTCGGGGGDTLIESLLEDPSKGSIPEGIVSPPEIYFNAVTNLFKD